MITKTYTAGLKKGGPTINPTKNRITPIITTLFKILKFSISFTLKEVYIEDEYDNNNTIE